VRRRFVDETLAPLMTKVNAEARCISPMPRTRPTRRIRDMAGSARSGRMNSRATTVGSILTSTARFEDLQARHLLLSDISIHA
jgi:hypothetical protein